MCFLVNVSLALCGFGPSGCLSGFLARSSNFTTWPLTSDWEEMTSLCVFQYFITLIIIRQESAVKTITILILDLQRNLLLSFSMMPTTLFSLFLNTLVKGLLGSSFHMQIDIQSTEENIKLVMQSICFYFLLQPMSMQRSICSWKMYKVTPGKTQLLDWMEILNVHFCVTKILFRNEFITSLAWWKAAYQGDLTQLVYNHEMCVWQSWVCVGGRFPWQDVKLCEL